MCWKKRASLVEPPKLWADVLIKPLFLCFLFIRTECEGDCPLRLEAVKSVIPIFFAAGYMNYKIWQLYYLHSMEDLPDHVHTHIVKGEHIIQLPDTEWSRIWSDMEIQNLCNQIGKGATEIIVESTNMETVKVWPYCLNSCCEIPQCLKAMKGKSSTNNTQKEEKKSRISHDQVDGDILRKKLEVSIDLFDYSQHECCSWKDKR